MNFAFRNSRRCNSLYSHLNAEYAIYHILFDRPQWSPSTSTTVTTICKNFLPIWRRSQASIIFRIHIFLSSIARPYFSNLSRFLFRGWGHPKKKRKLLKYHKLKFHCKRKKFLNRTSHSSRIPRIRGFLQICIDLWAQRIRDLSNCMYLTITWSALSLESMKN